MKTKLFSFVLLLISFNIHAQSVIGFWEVTSVKVGDEVMTPVAKWFRNNQDGTFESGNGWSQNAYGTWTFDEKTNEFVPQSENGVKDEFGPFEVSFTDKGMTFFRKEEGMDVYVNLVEIDKLPMGPADMIQGLWSLTEVKKDGEEITSTFDAANKQYIFIRPDRRFRLRNPDESFTNGYWHMDGHRPIFTLINYNRDVDYLTYNVSFEKDRLIMESQGDNKMVFIYDRINEFPE